MATERELLVDALTRVRIALEHPDISSNERAVIEMEFVRGWSEDQSRGCLNMTQREYRRTRSDALEKASVMPRLRMMKPPEPLEPTDSP